MRVMIKARVNQNTTRPPWFQIRVGGTGEGRESEIGLLKWEDFVSPMNQYKA